MTVAEHDQSSTPDNERQQQQEERIEADERVSMSDGEMEEKIDHEQDQKFDGISHSRYEDDVDQALSGDEG